MENTYAKACTEVLVLLENYLSEEEYEKIPKERIAHYKEYMDKNYEYKINEELSLEEQNISNKANSMIVALYREYFATEEEKTKINEILDLNERKIDAQKEKVDIFKQNNIKENTTQEIVALTEVKEKTSIFKIVLEKIISFINLFKR